MMKNLTLLAVLATALLAPSSLAGDLILGAQWGEGSIDIDVPGGSLSTEIEDDGFKGFIGYKFTRFVSAELAYTDLGGFSDTALGTDIDADAEVISAMVVGILPAGSRVEFFVKAGVTDWSSSVTLTDVLGSISASDDGTDLAYGAGISFRLGKHVALRGEWENYEFEMGDIEFSSVGVQFTF